MLISFGGALVGMATMTIARHCGYTHWEGIGLAAAAGVIYGTWCAKK